MHTDWARDLKEATAALKAALGMPRRGPWPGQGANAHEPWWGICEETAQFWASWLATWWRRRTRQPLPEHPPFTLEHGGRTLLLTSVRCTFGWRWYFRCPCCSRRTEVLYLGRRGLACRRCNRLGYRSQRRRVAEPPWLVAFSWGRQFGRSQCDARSIVELARDIQQRLAAELASLFDGFTLVSNRRGQERGDDDATA
ncbi:MAG: hypothetical protein IRY86_05540 [Thermorudis peleae]|nr:hypothetical protein [Thermorudis peleae]